MNAARRNPWRIMGERGRAGALLFLACAFGLLPTALSAQSLGGGRFTLAGGPVTRSSKPSDGGTFAVTGGTGEASAAPLTGGTFQVTGGPVGVAVVPGDVTLDFTVTDGQATLTWPAGTAGYVLEFTAALGEAADWQPVTPAPAGNSFTTPFNHPLRFFRLRRP